MYVDQIFLYDQIAYLSKIIGQSFVDMNKIVYRVYVNVRGLGGGGNVIVLCDSMVFQSTMTHHMCL